MINNEIILDDNAFLVSETNEKGLILFANEDFCKAAEYTLNELIGKPHNIVRHPDMPSAAFEDLWKTIKNGETWDGYVKNKSKTGKFYWVYATVYPFTTFDGKKGFISCRRKASREEIEEVEELYKTLH